MPFIELAHPVPTSAYHLPGSGPLFCLIPGNPGLIEYYTEYIDCLKEQLPDYAFLVISHLGCDTHVAAPGQFNSNNTVHGLDEQIQHKVDILGQFITSPRKVVLAGHSVGAWMVQHIALELKEHHKDLIEITQVLLLTPTIHQIVLSPKGSTFTNLVGYISRRPGTLLGRLAKAVYYTCPEFILKYAIQVGMGGGLGGVRIWRRSPGSDESVVPQHALDASLKMAQRPDILQQVGNMAVEEMVRIGDFKPELLPFWQSFEIWCFFAKVDEWVAPESQAAIIERFSPYPNVSFYVDTDPENGTHHAFCVRDSSKVAWLTVQQMMLRDQKR